MRRAFGLRIPALALVTIGWLLTGAEEEDGEECIGECGIMGREGAGGIDEEEWDDDEVLLEEESEMSRS